MHSFTSKTTSQTKQIAKKIRETYPNHNLILLSGELGSGKTVFAKGIGALLGIDERHIKSPTYTLIHEHTSTPKLLHADLYRLQAKDEIIMENINLWIGGKGIAIVEWPEVALEDFQKPHLHITIEKNGEDERLITVIEKNDERSGI